MMVFYVMSTKPQSSTVIQSRVRATPQCSFGTLTSMSHYIIHIHDHVMAHTKQCTHVSDYVITCVSPDTSEYTTGNAVVSIGLQMDGVQALLHLNTSLAVYAQPTFTSQRYTLTQNGDGTITIQVGLGRRRLCLK